MKFETLRNNKKILLFIVVFFLVTITLIISTSLAKYKVTESINIAKGTINYSPSDFSLMGIYIESDSGYTQTDTIPESGYELNSEESYCKIGEAEQDVKINYDFENQALSITPMTTKGLKCYLYFDVKANASDIIIANSKLGSGTPNFANTSCSSGCDEATVGIYTSTDDDGTSYFFRGDVDNNYVKFANKYWRIIRINGDGTIRLIYDGTTARNNGSVSETTQIGTSAFNSNYNNNMYVGYMYTSGSVHGFGTSSVIKGVLDNWYVSNLETYSSYLDINAGFCGDRTPYTNASGTTSGGGTSTITTYYGAFIRVQVNNSPSFKCASSSDLYTISSSNKGNKALGNPIGLITLDEAVFAGVAVSFVSNINYYLYTGQEYWTMTPSHLETLQSYVFSVSSNGNPDRYRLDGAYGVRPVINLRADVTLTGSGTSTDPYVVS